MSVSTSESSGRGGHKVRTVHLIRRHSANRGRAGFGFSVRGGREHGTGFFVSHVEPGSEAQTQGLRTGDQIVRINGYPVEDAVHHEVLQLVQAQNRLSLKVRTVGMLPVKEKTNNALSWCIIENEEPSPKSIVPTLNKDMPRDVRLSLNVAPNMKLGCGICKGPDWRPGIFVQFTKENGLARECGLRPGDQIVECNGISFTNIQFGDAVNLLKSSRQLDLLVSKGAGLDLFPGESSGYNSSASSLNGDQSPSWEDGKRLSVVKEESAELEERLGHVDSLDKNKQWDRIEYEWESKQQRSPGNSCTVIRVGQNGHLEDCSNKTNWDIERPPPLPPPPAPGSKLAEICMFSQQHETTMVVVEVHRSQETDQDEESKRPPPPPEGDPQLFKSSSSSSCSSLSSAISQELQRRLQRRGSEGAPQQESQRKAPLKAIDEEKRQQHEQLMEEFKKAHRKMFASSEALDETSSQSSENHDSEEREATRAKQRQQTDKHKLQAVKDRLQQAELHPVQTTNIHPVPPPPPPSDNLDSLSWSSKPSTIEKTSSTSSLSSGKSSPYGVPPACPTPDYDTTSLASSMSSSSSPVRKGGGPATTTVIVNKSPTYRSTTKVPISNSSQTSKKGADQVEMDSLESFELANPKAPQPKPPATYFASRINGRTTPSPESTVTIERNGTARKPRPVSVTIGEYPTGVDRKTPTRFEFLSGSVVTNGHKDDVTDAPVTCRLQSELAQTLSRSNLRKRTEEQENHLNGLPPGQPAKGTVTVSVNSEPTKSQFPNYYSCSHQTNNKVNLFSSQETSILSSAKPSIRSAAEKLGNSLGNNNRVTIRVNNGDSNGARTERL
ncbi:protein scribble homolog [Anabrus simplex]|uniref:protein scribble homolog n=1 Tax=Anabrus simplex TaxID=316456 RepID=UPI0035A2776A